VGRQKRTALLAQYAKPLSDKEGYEEGGSFLGVGWGDSRRAGKASPERMWEEVRQTGGKKERVFQRTNTHSRLKEVCQDRKGFARKKEKAVREEITSIKTGNEKSKKTGEREGQTGGGRKGKSLGEPVRKVHRGRHGRRRKGSEKSM